VCSSDLKAALAIPAKTARRAAKSAAESKALEAVAEKFAAEPEKAKLAKNVVEALGKKLMRTRIKEEGVRIDGRDLKTVRPLSIEVGVLPMTHGSCLFRRGETTALVTATLGSSRDEQRIETLTGEESKRFMLHYNFPSYSVGEVRPMRGPSRRDIGHGALAERAIAQVLPSPDEFPFTLRVGSEVLDSNGSSSMATVCGATLALMDAGVPIKEPVAGIAMGLTKEGDDYLVLTDILGDEDALGDMDFKVAGSKDGISGIQMDVKLSTGIPSDVLRRALAQARDARLHILEHMGMVLAKPRPELSDLAPQMAVLHINPEKIRSVIGPGGKNIKAITAETGADIDIEDSGKVSIFAPTLESLKRPRRWSSTTTRLRSPARTTRARSRSSSRWAPWWRFCPAWRACCTCPSWTWSASKRSPTSSSSARRSGSRSSNWKPAAASASPARPGSWSRPARRSTWTSSAVPRLPAKTEIAEAAAATTAGTARAASFGPNARTLGAAAARPPLSFPSSPALPAIPAEAMLPPRPPTWEARSAHAHPDLHRPAGADPTGGPARLPRCSGRQTRGPGSAVHEPRREGSAPGPNRAP
jgi:ribonuclease PH